LKNPRRLGLAKTWLKVPLTAIVRRLLALVNIEAYLSQIEVCPKAEAMINGSNPAQTTNFLLPANAALFTGFFNSVVYFFEAALGCTDNSVVAYTGPSMTAAHASLGINYNQYAAFNTIVCNVVSGAGFSAPDTASVASVLSTLNTSICTAKDCTNICNKYSVPCNLNNNALVTVVVNMTVNAVLATPLVQFFNGSISGQTNFLTNSGAFNTLFAHLVQFFGSALGCTDGSIGSYAGAPLTTAHAGLGITVAQFNQFNSILLGVMTSLGVSPADVAAVSGVLNGTQSQIVSGSAGTTTTKASGSSGGASTTGGAVSMIIASFFAVILALLI